MSAKLDLGKKENSFLIDQHQTFFDLYQPSEVQEAFNQGLKLAYKNIRAIYRIKNQDRNFHNTVLAIARASSLIEYISSIVHHLCSVEYNKWYNAQTFVQDEMSKYSNKIIFDQKLYQALLTVRDNQLDLGPEEIVLLSKMIREYENSGIHLAQDKQKQLKKLNILERRLITKFDKNIIDYKEKHPIYVKNIAQLAGIDPHTIRIWQQEALAGGYQEGCLIRLSDNNTSTILADASSETFRRMFNKANMKVAYRANMNLTIKILDIRWQKAALLGKDNPSQYLMQERMIKDPQEVLDFIDTLKPHYQKRGLKEYAELLAFKNKSLGQSSDVMSEYDYGYGIGLYWKNKLFHHLHQADISDVKEYCQLDLVLKTMLDFLAKMYNVSFRPSTIKSWNQDNIVYEVISDHKTISIIHLDLFSRNDKQNGAWQNSLIIGGRADNYPSSMVVAMNLSSPTKLDLVMPTLMNYSDVLTLWHEFGHCLHMVFSKTIYPENHAGHSAWDFIEMPSQLMENWGLNPDLVKIYARHYQTGKPLSAKKIEHILKTKKYMNGVQNLRQLYLASLDILLHSKYRFKSVKELDHFQKELKAEFLIGPVDDYFSILNNFAHIHHGYKSGYYTYKWSDSLQADVFTVFQKEGLANPKVWRRYKNTILSKGASGNPNQLLLDFLERKPNPKAVLQLDIL